MTTLFMYLEPTKSMTNTGENEETEENLKKYAINFPMTRSKVECIGGPIVAVGNARQIKNDTVRSLSLAFYNNSPFTLPEFSGIN